MTRFTGRHMTAIIVGFFGVVITVNIIMATFALTTFGGTVVDDSYAAGQKFNQWLHDAKRQDSAGWGGEITRLDNGHIQVVLTVPEGDPTDLRLEGFATLPLGKNSETSLAFDHSGDGFTSKQSLPEGRWTVRIIASTYAGDMVARFEQDLQP